MNSGVHTYWRGVYEKGLTTQLESTVKPGMSCYDCGANVGYFTLLMSRLVGRNGRVFSFEPLPENANYLHRHVGMNHCANVTIIESACSDYNGKVNFSSDGSASRINAEGKIEVDCRTIDSLDLPPPDLMKVDVEGAEVLLISGAEETIRMHKPTIFMSLHIPVPLAEALADRISAFGYTVTFSKSSYELTAMPRLHDPQL
jgi:FkbM family methyltransferase